MKKIIEFVKVGFKQRIVYRKSTFWGDRGRQGTVLCLLLICSKKPVLSDRLIFGGAYRFVSEPGFIFVSGIFGCIFPRNML